MEKKSIDDFKTFNEKRFSKQVLYKESGHTAFVLNFLPGQNLPDHKHPGMTLYLFVLEGTGLLYTDGKETVITRNDILNIEEDEVLSILNNSENPLTIYVNLSKKKL